MKLIDECKVVELKNFGDERGNMVVIEGNSTIPFDIKRVFYSFGTDKDAIRGQHANKFSDFVLINVSGNCNLKVTDGKEEKIFCLNTPFKGVYVPKLIWKEMYDFSSDSVLLVITNTHYDSNEYIRDFIEYVSFMEDLK